MLELNVSLCGGQTRFPRMTSKMGGSFHVHTLTSEYATPTSYTCKYSVLFWTKQLQSRLNDTENIKLTSHTHFLGFGRIVSQACQLSRVSWELPGFSIRLMVSRLKDQISP